MAQDIPYFEDESSRLHPDLPVVERPTINAVLWNPQTNEVLCLDWQEFGWITFIIGGIEGGEEPVEAACREIEEETGYTDIEFVANLGKLRSAYFAAHKKENRIANTIGLLFKLTNDKRKNIPADASLPHIPKWIPKNDVASLLGLSSQKYLWIRAQIFL